MRAQPDEDGARVEISRVEPGLLAEGFTVQVVLASGAVARLPLSASGNDRASVALPWSPDWIAPAIARVLDPSGRPVAWVALEDPARRELLPVSGGAASLRALAALTGGEVVETGSLPSWLGRPQDPKGRPLSVPLGLLALGAAVCSVWARRPPARVQPA